MMSARVTGIPEGTPMGELQQYFSNPLYGGGQVDKIYYPLSRNEAVIIFNSNVGATELFQRTHTVAGACVTVSHEPNQIYRSVTTQLEPHVTQLLDQNSSHLDHLQFEGDLEVTFDPDSMNYLLSGNWYQLEWAWFYLEKVCAEVDQKVSETEKDVTETNNLRKKSEMTNDFNDTISLSSTDSDDASSYHRYIESGRTYGITKQWRDTHSLSDPSEKGNFRSRDPGDTRNIRRSSPELSLEDSAMYPHVKSRSVYPATRFPFERENQYDVENTRRNGIDTKSANEHPWTSNFNKSSRSPFLPRSPVGGTDFPFWNCDGDNDDYVPFHQQGIFDKDYKRMNETSRCDIVPTESHHKEATQSTPDSEDASLSLKLNIGPLDVKVEFGNLLTARTDGIVSPASTDLTNQYGLAAVISRAAGYDMSKECQEYIEKHGSLCIGDVIHTCAGGTLDKRVGVILHVAGPSWREDSAADSAHLLTCTYLNCFQYANRQLWMKSIAMPLISAGILGVPLDVCVQSFHDALLLHVHGDESTRHLQEVTLLNNDKESACATIVILRSLMELDENKAQKAAIERYLGGCLRSEFQAKHCILNNIAAAKDSGEFVSAGSDSSADVSKTENTRDTDVMCNVEEEEKLAISKYYTRKRPNEIDSNSEEGSEITLPSVPFDERDDNRKYSLKQYCGRRKEKVFSTKSAGRVESTGLKHEDVD